MITKEEIDKIHKIFMHLQWVDGRPVQKYDPLEEYRQGIVIAKGLNYNQDANEVYCHTAKFTAWHKKIWEKRKKEIPHTPFVTAYPELNIFRVGFKSLK